MSIKTTEKEDKAIASLQRAANKMPKSLWLFSASGDLKVMKKLPNGKRAMTSNGDVDQEYIVDEIIGIENDGGDW